MIIKNFNVYFFFTLLIGVSALGFMLIKPFVGAIFIAALIAVIFSRPYNFLLKKIHSAPVTSAIMLVIVMITLFIPILFIGGLVFNEMSNIVIESSVDSSNIQLFIQKFTDMFIQGPLANSLLNSIKTYIHGPEFSNAIKDIANTSVVFIQTIYKSIVNSSISIFVMFFSLFYFFIDGKKFVKYVMYLSPMKDIHEQKLINEFISMTRATLKGTVVIGSIQGIIGGIAFGVAGVASPVLWMIIMIVLGIIPAIGAGLIIFPAAVVMLILGNVWQGIFLFVTGFFVSTIDNFLRPKLVGRDTQMHSLVVFFATIGGLKLFGLMGFIFGPIIAALMIAMWKIYAWEFKEQLQKFNA